MAAPDLSDLGERAVAAAREVALAPTTAKDAALVLAADLLEERSDELLAANAVDIERAERAESPRPAVDRLRLTGERVHGLASGLRQVALLPDPVGQTVAGWVRPDGLEIRQVRVPLGVVGVIYENRPNVTSDAAALCVKGGNAVLLRGRSAAITANRALAAVLHEACGKAGLPADAVQLVEDTSREGALAFMRLRGVIDCLVPRGGPALIAAVVDNATVPYVVDGDGNCHVYVDRAADLDMAVAIVVNGKTQRPGVCNATESLVVHRAVAAAFLPRLAPALDGVDLVGDDEARAVLGADRVRVADETDWGREYLDLRLSVRVVASIDEAIAHVRRYGTGHTEAIVTGDRAAARRFQREVDAAVVAVNASTRFTDGEQFGFGAEIGISTQKLHARGPMGLLALTTTRYLVDGDGHVRP
ncbi:MAG: glutamate-5-semialdehyde dehydrogenase [Acidimicrobiales bacterium]